MPYLVDSTHVIYYLNDLPDAVELLDRLTPAGIAVSIITYIEVFQGVEASPHPRRARAKFNAFFDSVPVLPITIEVAQRCARLRRTLKVHGRRALGIAKSPSPEPSIGEEERVQALEVRREIERRLSVSTQRDTATRYLEELSDCIVGMDSGGHFCFYEGFRNPTKWTNRAILEFSKR